MIPTLQKYAIRLMLILSYQPKKFYEQLIEMNFTLPR
jgi:hypothetical protein